MIRTLVDLAAIDRELELLGHVRPDVSELVARYATARSTPPGRADEASEPPEAAGDQRRVSAAPGSPPPVPAFASSDTSSDEDEDHDEFELLVDDEEIERIDDDLFEPAE